MPTSIETIDAPSVWSQTGGQITFTALDNVEGNMFICSDHMIVVVHNTDASAQAVRFTSEPHSATGRVGDINQSIPAGDYWSFRLTKDGWANVDTCVIMPSGQSANLLIAIINL